MTGTGELDGQGAAVAARAALEVVAGAGSGDLADVRGTGDLLADASGEVSLSLGA